MSKRIFGVAMLVAVMAVSGAAMADQTWDGDTDTDFENGANWVSGSAPADDTTTDLAVFSGTTTYLPLLTTDRSVNGLSFNSGTRSVFDSGTTHTLTLGSYGVQATGEAYTTLGTSAILSISGPTDIKQGGGTGYGKGYLKIDSKITGTGGLVFSGTKLNSYQTSIYLSGDNDFTGGVTFNKAAYVHVQHQNALGAKPNLEVTVVGSDTGQSSYASKLYLENATGFSANIDNIIIDGEKKYKAAFYQAEGTTMSTKLTLNGGTYGFSSAGTGARYNDAEIALKTGTTSTIAKDNGRGTWYQTGVISGDGSLYVKGYNANDTTVYFNGDNTYTGGTVVEKQSNEKAIYAGHNNAWGTGPVRLAADTDTKTAFQITADLTMANDFSGRGVIATGSYQLTTTGSISPGASIGQMGVEDLIFGSPTDDCVYNWEYDETTSDLLVTSTFEFGGQSPTVNVSWLGAGDPLTGDFVLATYTGADPTLPSGGTINAPEGLVGEGWIDVDNNRVMLTLSAPPIPEPAGLSFLGLALLGLRRRRS